MSPERRLHRDQGCRRLPAHSLAEGPRAQKGHCPPVGQGRTREKPKRARRRWFVLNGVSGRVWPRDQVSRVDTEAEMSSGWRVGAQRRGFEVACLGTLLSLPFPPGQSHETLIRRRGHWVWLTQGLGHGNDGDLTVKGGECQALRGALSPRQWLGPVRSGSP